LHNQTHIHTQEIHGLGPGGNKPRSAPLWTQTQQAPTQGAATQSAGRADPEEDGQEDADKAGGQQQQRQQGGGGRGGRGRGAAAQPNYAKKEANKGAVANHHRKDKAMKKMGMF